MSDQFKDLDHIFYIIGGNVLDCPYKRKGRYKPWKKYQTSSISKKEYEISKKEHAESNWAVITGKTRRGAYQGKYLVVIDLDNNKAIEEFLSHFFNKKRIEEIYNLTIVVQHEDTKNQKAHIYFITERSIAKKCGIGTTRSDKIKDDNIPHIEVKSDSSTMVMCPPSVHQNGYPYQIMGTRAIMELDECATIKLEQALNQIYQKYSSTIELSNGIASSILSKDLINIARTLVIDDKVSYIRIVEGTRSNSLISFGRYLLNYHYSSRDINFLRDFIIEVNQKLCDPPLPENELLDIWNKDVKYYYNDLEHKLNKDKITKPDNQKDFINKIPDRNPVKIVIDTAKKTIKRENSLIRLILYTGLSTYTTDPLNLGIIASTSEGKTYVVTEIIKFFPKQDVWILGNMSPKVLIRDKGILVDNNNYPIKEKIQEISRKIKEENDKDKKTELEEQRKSLYENSKVLIDLSNKILVFLEPPHSETWNILKPILSHDTLEIEHPYVYKADKGFEVKHIVTKGWPACIFCSARDDSSWSMWPEIQSRFFIASPNMIKQKYQESNILIAQRKGLPQFVQEQLIVSKEGLFLAQECVRLLKEQLLANHKNNVWIPFNSILAHSLPSEKGPDVRITNRIFSILSLITKINLINRPKLVFGNETLAISLPEDLEEVLKLTHNLSGIPSYKIEFFTNIFMPLYLSKKSPLEKDGIIEDKIAVYSDELADFYKQISGKPLTTDAIKKTYLTELKNNGLIDDFKSTIDKRKNGFYPIVDVDPFITLSNKENKYYTNLEEPDNNLQFFKLKLSRNCNKIDERWLQMEILTLLNYGIGQLNIFKLLDENDKEICMCQFVKKYNNSGNLNRYFQTDENCIYSEKIFGSIIKIKC